MKYFLLILFLASCQPAGDNKPAPPRNSCDEYLVSSAMGSDNTVGSADMHKMRYFKNDEINTCFAYMWTGSGYGGGTLATIDCDRVPANMLVHFIPR